MAAHTVLLWRHGRTAHNVALRLQGQVDIPLDDVGHRQAATAAAAITATVGVDAIVASDLGRARATAAHLADRTGHRVVVDERVRERGFGLWEGLTGDEIADRWPQEYRLWRSGGDPEGVEAETRSVVAERMVAAITEHADRLESSQTLVVVSHGAAITLAVTRMLGIGHGVAWAGRPDQRALVGAAPQPRRRRACVAALRARPRAVDVDRRVERRHRARGGRGGPVARGGRPGGRARGRRVTVGGWSAGGSRCRTRTTPA